MEYDSSNKKLLIWHEAIMLWDLGEISGNLGQIMLETELQLSFIFNLKSTT